MNLSVIVPTYNRPAELRRCLTALARQKRLPDQVLLVLRNDDQSSHLVAVDLESSIPLSIVKVNMPGQVNALNAGLAAVTGDVIAITDDDAAPRPEWLELIEQHFSCDQTIGGIGGRDWVHHGSEVDTRSARLVGTIQWFGRIVGNHHLGEGAVRKVDILKGANMSYRLTAISGVKFDSHLRGKGAQVSNDLAFSLAVRKKGWKLIYDPAVAVDHYPAPRFDLDQRDTFHPQTIEDAAFNQYWALLSAMSPGLRQSLACIWQRHVGSKTLPGLAHGIMGLIRSERNTIERWRAADQGRAAAVELWEARASR